ncbi:uncharacterized protein LOC135194515 [Vanessa tameamea]|uniref:Uncharacterized protein LOC135194515 n=1 Tax=Vanessa tameamea TaxID=334116 RepID=A0ABM4AXU4_VANTA
MAPVFVNILVHDKVSCVGVPVDTDTLGTRSTILDDRSSTKTFDKSRTTSSTSINTSKTDRDSVADSKPHPAKCSGRVVASVRALPRSEPVPTSPRAASPRHASPRHASPRHARSSGTPPPPPPRNIRRQDSSASSSQSPPPVPVRMAMTVTDNTARKAKRKTNKTPR